MMRGIIISIVVVWTLIVPISTVSKEKHGTREPHKQVSNASQATTTLWISIPVSLFPTSVIEFVGYPERDPPIDHGQDASKREPIRRFTCQWIADWSGHWVDEPLTVVTTILMFLTWRYVVHAKRQARSTAETAAVAKTAADAALAALDRPWLVIEELRHNRIDSAEDLIGTFRVSNYGKAPAFIMVVTATFFHSLGRFRETGFPIQPLPDDIRHFPEPCELREFINKWGRSPRSVSNSLDDAKPLRRDKDDIEIAVPSGGQTDTFFFIGTPRSRVLDESIPIQDIAGIFLIGRMIYSIPGRDSEVINFCYQGNSHGRFDLLYGPPYNERQKTP